MASDLAERMQELARDLDQMAKARQAWAESPEIGGAKPRFGDHLRGKRYGYSHAAQLIRAALKAHANEPADVGDSQLTERKA